MPLVLVVTHPFDFYTIVNKITDPDVIDDVLNSHPAHVVRRNDPDPAQADEKTASSPESADDHPEA